MSPSAPRRATPRCAEPSRAESAPRCTSRHFAAAPRHAALFPARSTALRLTSNIPGGAARTHSRAHALPLAGPRTSREHPARSVGGRRGTPRHSFFSHALLPDGVLRSANAILAAPPSLHRRYRRRHRTK